MICSTGMHPADEESHRGAFRAGSAAAGLAVVLSAATCLAFVAFHGWETRPSNRTIQQETLAAIVDYGGFGPLGLPTVLVAIFASSLVAGGLIGRRATRMTGTALPRCTKILGLELASYFAVALVVSVLQAALTPPRTPEVLWIVPLLAGYGLFVASVLLPLTIAPLAVSSALLESWTRRGAEHSSDIPRPLSRRLLVAALLLAAPVLCTYAAISYARRKWYVVPACTVTAGMTRAAVRLACGAPTDTGIQPRREQLVHRAPFREVCSADVDVFGYSRIDYDCEGRVANVVTLDTAGYIRAPDSFAPTCSPDGASR